jgi:hypothetical protein
MKRNVENILVSILAAWFAVLSVAVHGMHNHGLTGSCADRCISAAKTTCPHLPERTNSFPIKRITASSVRHTHTNGHQRCLACQYLSDSKSVLPDIGMQLMSEYDYPGACFCYQTPFHESFAHQSSFPRAPPLTHPNNHTCAVGFPARVYFFVDCYVS